MHAVTCWWCSNKLLPLDSIRNVTRKQEDVCPWEVRGFDGLWICRTVGGWPRLDGNDIYLWVRKSVSHVFSSVWTTDRAPYRQILYLLYLYSHKRFRLQLPILRNKVCLLIVCRSSHWFSLLEPIDGLRCHLAF